MTVAVTFAGTRLLGRLLGLPPARSLLIATGFSICGASAVAAMKEVADGDEDDAAVAIALVTLFGSLAIFALPALRLLADALGWRSIFLINVPIGMLGSIGTLVFLPADRTAGDRSAKGFDLLGAVLFAGFSSSFLLGLGAGPSAGWVSWPTLGLLGAALAFLVFFAAQEVRSAGPVIELRLFRRRVFGLGNVAGFLAFVLMLFRALLFPLYLHEVMDRSLATTGLLMTLQAVAMLLVSPVAGRWSDRVGSRQPTLVALALTTLAMLGSVLLGPASPLWLIGAVLGLFGVALGLFLSPHNSALMGDLPRERAGTAGAILATVRNLGKSVGVAAAVLVYSAFAGTSATVAVDPDVLLSGFRGTFAVGAVLAGVALVAVVAMYWRQQQTSAEGASGRMR